MFTDKEYTRIFSRISIDPESGCWNWTGKLDRGYGRVYWRGRYYKAHRLLYLWRYGELPDWEDYSSPEADHLCRNRACVNPEHIQIVSKQTNIVRGEGPTAINARKEFCIHGHPLEVVGNRRRCRICDREMYRSEHRKAWKRKYYEEHYKRH